MECVYCAVRTEYLYVIQANLHRLRFRSWHSTTCFDVAESHFAQIAHLWILYDSHNNSDYFPEED
jgi:hypothetical protein